MSDPSTPDRPLTLHEFKKHQNGSTKVGLTTGTWLTLIGTILTIIAMGAGLSWSVFETEAQAMQQYGQIRLDIQETLLKHSVVPHPTAVSKTELKTVENNIHKLDKKISILGVQQGLGREMRQVDEESASP